MALPAELGGYQAEPAVQLQAVVELSEVDASLGWYAMIGSDGGYYSSFLDPAVAEEMYKPDPDAITAGFVDPVGRARAVDGGYRVSGRWSFGSAATHSTWLASGCWTEGTNGERRWIVAMLPAAECEFHDTWHSIGLRGSGSVDYSAHELFVPEPRTFSFDKPRRTEPLYRFPMMYRANVPGVAIGMARGAVRDFVGWAAERRDPATGAPMRESLFLQRALGLAEARVASAHAYAKDVLAELWETVRNGDEPTAQTRARMRLMIAHTGRDCREAVRVLFEASGGSAVYDRHPLQRRMRDAMTIAQHALVNERNYASAGRVLCGLDAVDRAF
jgi:alkylation response protein AidB-like acyl-CoA dehydrogenase